MKLHALVLFACTALAFATPLGAGGVTILETTLSDNGDDDGFADTNETVSLVLTVQNNSGVELSDVTALLTTKTPELVCITTSTVDLGSFANGEIKLSDPFVFHVLDVDRTALGLGPYDPLTASFELFVVRLSRV